MHINILDLKTETCEICGSEFPSALQLEWHMETDHECMDLQCLDCGLLAVSENELQRHMVSHHGRIRDQEGLTIGQLEEPPISRTDHTQNFGCGSYENTFSTPDYLEEHVKTNHNRHSVPVEPFPCEICGLVFGEFSSLQTHMITHHRNQVKSCHYCQFTAKDEDDLQEHMIENHENIVILHTMAKQVDEMKDQFTNLEQSVSDLKSIKSDILAIKQELFVIRNSLPVNDQNEQVKDKEMTPKYNAVENPCKTVNNENVQQKPKILLVGDSITNHVNIDKIEEATDAVITKVKAYSAIYDDISNEAKDKAKFPSKNFLQVVPCEVRKENFEHLVVQAGSIDISNLRTKDNPENNLEYFRQQTFMSAKNTFDSCLLALDKQPSLKSVTIMKQTPRYDPLTTDPLAIKPALSQLFNNTLTELWLSCPLKNKIYIGTHNIDCTVAVQSAR